MKFSLNNNILQNQFIKHLLQSITLILHCCVIQTNYELVIVFKDFV